jgi:L-cysteine desulfidase
MQIKDIIENQTQKLNETLATIESIQFQLNELKQSLRVEQQLAQAQKTAENEVNKWLKEGEKLLKDCTGVFPIDFLDGIKDKIDDLTENVKDNYLELSQSDRFLHAEIEEKNDIPLIVPSDDLTQFEEMIDSLDEVDFKKLKIICDISTRINTRITVAKKLQGKMSFEKLVEIINSFKSNLYLLKTAN